jgi:uncharacterized protein YbbK (DUF523 family)
MDIASACLVGEKCRYDGRASEDAHVKQLWKQGNVMPVCPEILAGLTAPRSPCEIVGGCGDDVLSGKAIVKDADGMDQTAVFIVAAQRTLAIAISNGSQSAYLKSRSPSCGCGIIYDGSFSGKLVSGDGVTTALLKKNGIIPIEV